MEETIDPSGTHTVHFNADELIDRSDEIADLLNMHKIQPGPFETSAILFTAIANWPLQQLLDGTFLELVNKLIALEVSERNEGGDS